jgi:hypothetical protein
MSSGPEAPETPWWRVPLLLTGVGALGWGAWLLLTGGRSTAPTGSLEWLAGALLGHDAVLAPLAVAAGWATLRLTGRLPAAARRAIAGGLFVAACLVLVALPALLAPGIDNATATPRDYGRGLAVLLLAVAAAVALVVALAVGAVAVRTAAARRTAGRRPPTAHRDASR